MFIGEQIEAVEGDCVLFAFTDSRAVDTQTLGLLYFSSARQSIHLIHTHITDWLFALLIDRTGYRIQDG